MMMNSKIILVSLFVLFQKNCFSQELNGFWVSNIFLVKGLPHVIWFEENKFIDYSISFQDTLVVTKNNDVYKFSGDILNHKDLSYEYKLVRTRDELRFYSASTDSLLRTYNRALSKNIVFDLQEAPKLSFELASGSGVISYTPYIFRELFYITSGSNGYTIKTKDGSFNSADSLYTYLMAKDSSLNNFTTNRQWRKGLVVDNNLSVADFNEVLNSFRNACYLHLSFILASPIYEYIKFKDIDLRKPSYSKDIASQLFYYEKFFNPQDKSMVNNNMNRNTCVVELTQEGLKLNDSILDTIMFQNRLIEEITQKDSLAIYYHLSENFLFQDYVDLISLLNRAYNKLYHQLNSNYHITEKRTISITWKEFHHKYPKKFVYVNRTELERIKENENLPK